MAAISILRRSSFTPSSCSKQIAAFALPYPFLRILSLNLDGFWAVVEGKKERKCEVVVRACKRNGIVAVAEAHLSRFDLAAVNDFAIHNSLTVFVGIHSPGAEEGVRAATAAHDQAQYDKEKEGTRAGGLFSISKDVAGSTWFRIQL